ncbi:helix-turn-helix domain-containing protein [Rhizobium leguminosarum]|uniref:helix-turn-helix domain-containing protein n=1 Tax=Rhizobium leguminosarum TaxID=384 RepID=UPI001C969281|nr:helix-turn-helix domain-containing protein [Rhizobium leguminosarum]
MVGLSNITPTTNMTIPADPLLIAINAYRDALDGYGKAIEGKDDWIGDSGCDALYEDLICGPFAALANWGTPASSHEVALAAIALADFEKVDSAGSAVSDAMEAAATGFWKTAGEIKPTPDAVVLQALMIPLEGKHANVNLTAKEAADYLRVTEVTLARWRSTKLGPHYIKSGGKVLYRVSDLLDYVAKNERKGTRPDK